MKLKELLLLAVCFTIISTAQAQTLKEIVQQVLTVTKEKKLTIPQFFEITKRFAKLDVHPTVASVAIPGRADSLQARNVSVYIWGVAAHEIFNIPIKEARVYPGALVKDGAENKKHYIEDVFWTNRFGFISLVNDIQKSSSSIFVQQMSASNDRYVRIDSVFRDRGNAYWKYRLPVNSQFSIAKDLDTLSHYKFSVSDQSILEKLTALGVYCAYKEQDKVIFIVSGLLDNMFGYIYSKNPIEKNIATPSLHTSILEPAGENFYYYVSN